MKQYTTAIALASMCWINHVFAQPFTSSSNASSLIDAGSVLKKVSIEPVSKNIAFVSPAAVKLKPGKVQLKLYEQLEATKALCPLLQAEVTVELEGERKNNATALLNWKAKHAFYAQQYLVERSIGDTLHFEQVHYVWPNEKAANREKYELDDFNEYQQRSYYRIRLVLLSGKIIYSNIAEVKNDASASLTVYPNPARNTISIDANKITQPITGITILDAAGKPVVQRAQRPVPGQPLNISSLANGSYWVKVEMDDKTFRLARFIKQ